MKQGYAYSLTSIALYIVIILFGDNLFRSSISVQPTPETKAIQYRYISPYITISNFDHYFREAGEILDYDWKLIAAIAHTESRFDSTARSGAGACGIMQVMPRTLRRQGVPDSLHMEPRNNIMAATSLLKDLDRIFRRITNKEERTNFVLASYNAGIGEISDAMRLAEKYGRNRYKWENNVDTFLILKSQPQYYNDSLCKNGDFKDWQQTLSFVKKVKRTWQEYEQLQQAYNDSVFEILQSDTTVKIRKEKH